MPSACFESEASSSGTRLYTQLWYGMIRLTCMYNRLPEDEPLASKHAADIKIKN
jgi:hypothetical protein